MSQNKYPTDPTVTVAIIGLGERDETLVRQAKGEGLDGESVDYDSAKRPDGRHFKLSAYPVVVSSLKVILKTRNRTSLEDDESDILSASMYFQDETYGYIVLKHPLKAGEQLRVQYVASFDKNNPRLFSRDQLTTLYSYYGVPSITNTVSLGARIAFASGAQYVLATLGESLDVDPLWDRAFAALENEFPYYVVPLPPQLVDLSGRPIPELTEYSSYSMIAQRASQFVDKMSSVEFRNECVLVLGETGNLTQEDAKFLFGSSERVLFASPGEVQYALLQGQYQTFDGRLLAPVLAGLLASVNVTETAMGKDESAVIVTNKFKKSATELQELTTNGISFFIPSAGGAKILRPITTSQSSNPVLQEPSVLRIRDYIAYSVRRILEARFIGKPIVVNLDNDILKMVVNFCKAQIEAKLLTDAKNFKVIQDKSEPRQMDVSFDIEPVFPLVYINVSFRVMLL